MDWWKIPGRRWFKTTRDSQRGKVYKAERTVWENKLAAERIETVPEIQKWVDKICSYAWFKRRFGQIRIRVEDGRGRRAAGGERVMFCTLDFSTGSREVKEVYDGYIKMPLWSRTKLIILHEMSHVLNKYKPAHGRFFARCFLTVVNHVLGKDVYKELAKAFKENRVKYLPFREMTDEARKAAAERLKPFQKNISKIQGAQSQPKRQ